MNDCADTIAADASGWERRLRDALAGSSDAEPRPMSRTELPLHLDRLIESEWLAKLRRAAVLVPVVDRPGGPTVVLTQRSEHLRNHKGQISFPGGRRDDDDVDSVDTALREAEEEIGLPRQHVEVLGYLDDYPTISLYRVTPVVGVIRELPLLRIDAAEVAEAFEVPLSLLLDPASYERKHLFFGTVKRPFYEVNYGSYRIWGATAGMLWDLCRKVNA
ncbi:MAG: CoA pyrophosphatase [Hydrocarboniphaga sp.]|uniref:CoA pyrophosphatase n=1 Tax=Hydrocarboniphaga sp. TaxID=2033016 RepID=UPI00261645D2|nr:CoA pyrophosphatase [Hydrocarboniphaga sp.]MDB5970718.1 CoA pyrophosphatase [Hydrocarboniphaga sp.]